jgi:hypothetical protein
MGDDHRPLIADANALDCASIFREVTASTNGLISDSEAAGASDNPPAALPCPPYAPFSWTAFVGRRTDSEGVRLPHRRTARRAQHTAGAIALKRFPSSICDLRTWQFRRGSRRVVTN